MGKSKYLFVGLSESNLLFRFRYIKSGLSLSHKIDRAISKNLSYTKKLKLAFFNWKILQIFPYMYIYFLRFRVKSRLSASCFFVEARARSGSDYNNKNEGVDPDSCQCIRILPADVILGLLSCGPQLQGYLHSARCTVGWEDFNTGNLKV